MQFIQILSRWRSPLAGYFADEYSIDSQLPGNSQSMEALVIGDVPASTVELGSVEHAVGCL
jgi:hypothetical protein